MHAKKADSDSSLMEVIARSQDVNRFRELLWEGSYGDYLEMVQADRNIARNAYQRLYDLIESYGTEEYTEYKKTIVRYKFFDDPFGEGRDAIYGIDIHLMKLVRVLRAAALNYGPEKRVLLLHGPVGSAKSTIARLFKKGLEYYSRTEVGRLYTYSWLNADGTETPCPMHEEPLRLLPNEARPGVLNRVNSGDESPYSVVVEGDLCPVCRFMYRQTMREVSGDFLELAKRIRVRRMVLSEKDRIGIGTFQPKDEKNQDSTELTGDINYRLIAEYGSDSDPRAFNFDGEFNIANRGHDRVHRGAQARRRLPLRSAGRVSQEHRSSPRSSRRPTSTR